LISLKDIYTGGKRTETEPPDEKKAARDLQRRALTALEKHYKKSEDRQKVDEIAQKLKSLHV